MHAIEITAVTDAPAAAQRRQERRRLTSRDVSIPAHVLTQLTTEELYAALGVLSRSRDVDHVETSAALDAAITEAN